MYVYMNVSCMYVYVFMYVCVYVCLSVCMYTCIHVYCIWRGKLKNPYAASV